MPGNDCIACTVPVDVPNHAIVASTVAFMWEAQNIEPPATTLKQLFERLHACDEHREMIGFFVKECVALKAQIAQSVVKHA